MSNRLYRNEREASFSLTQWQADEDFGPMPGARSESVGAEYEPARYDADAMPLLRWFIGALVLVVCAIGIAVMFGGKP